ANDVSLATCLDLTRLSNCSALSCQVPECAPWAPRGRTRFRNSSSTAFKKDSYVAATITAGSLNNSTSGKNVETTGSPQATYSCTLSGFTPRVSRLCLNGIIPMSQWCMYALNCSYGRFPSQ